MTAAPSLYTRGSGCFFGVSILTIFYSLIAATCFAVGGLLMKMSSGLTRLWPTVAFLGLFAVGAVMQALAMRGGAMGSVYVAVLGLEAVLAVSLAVFWLGERLTAVQLGAILLIVIGVALLRHEGV